jgi:hypothetical protein
MMLWCNENNACVIGLVWDWWSGGWGNCGMSYRLNVIEIVALNEVGTWVLKVVRNMF